MLKMTHVTHVWGVIGLALATWSVALGGLASLQNHCSDNDRHPDLFGLMGIRGISSNLGCGKVYRYYWFMLALEFVLVAGLAASVVGGLFRKTRLSWLGLFAVVALLYIQATDTFLTFKSRAYFNHNNEIGHRARTALAGYLMTAVANLVAIFVLGLEPDAAGDAAKADTVQATAV